MGAKRYEEQELEVWQIADELKREVHANRGYLTPERVVRALQLAEPSIRCSKKFILYLKSCSKRPKGK
jgi:hypothetical protein